MGVVESIYLDILNKGWCLYNPEWLPSDGYLVGSNYDESIECSLSEVREYFFRNQVTLLANCGHLLMVFVKGDDGKIWCDVSRWYKSLELATLKGLQTEQLTLWDVAEAKTKTMDIHSIADGYWSYENVRWEE